MPDVPELIDGLAVHTTGTGPAIVLLHANAGSHEDFAAITAPLARRHTVHAIDWPGWGESPNDGDPTATGYAALLPRVLDRLPGAPFVLLGNSVGGFAAIRSTATHPELVRALVLVDPGGFTPRWPGSTAACRAIGSTRLAPTMMRTLPRLYLRRSNTFVQAIRTNATAMADDPARVRSFASLWRSFARPDHDARADASEITVPTLLVWGRRDPVLPWLIDGRRARRALPHAQVSVLRCGHQAFAEVPREFLDALEPFLRSIDSRRTT